MKDRKSDKKTAFLLDKFDALSVSEKTYKKFNEVYKLATEELMEGEYIMKLYWGHISRITFFAEAYWFIFTNRRIMIRNRKLDRWNEGTDIFLEDINEDSINTSGGNPNKNIFSYLHFSAKGEEYFVITSVGRFIDLNGAPKKIYPEDFKKLSQEEKDRTYVNYTAYVILKHLIRERKKEIVDIEYQNRNNNAVLAEIDNIVHVDGIPLLGAGKRILMKLYIDKIIIDAVGEKEKYSYKIKINSINNIKIKTETEISERERHVLARAVAGGLLFGGVGAIVGAVSGVPGKQTKTDHNFLVLDYTDKEGNQKSLMFLCVSDLKQILERLDIFLHILRKKVMENKSEGNEIEL